MAGAPFSGNLTTFICLKKMSKEEKSSSVRSINKNMIETANKDFALKESPAKV
jgi:hypothetical protein